MRSEPDVGPDRLLPRFKTPALREEAVADLGLSQAERVALQARVAEIEAGLERHQIDIADRAITSPIAGW